MSNYISNTHKEKSLTLKLFIVKEVILACVGFSFSIQFDINKLKLKAYLQQNIKLKSPDLLSTSEVDIWIK